MADREASRRQEALELAEELLADIELSRIPGAQVARKASRLARLLDDSDAIVWLAFESGAYQIEDGNTLGPTAWEAARRSNRLTLVDGAWKATTTPLGELETNIEAGMTQLEAAADRPVSITSANPRQFVAAPPGNATERGTVRHYIGNQRALLEKVVGAIHQYVAARYQELRFGSAVETAFEVVRADVDGRVADLVPDALPMLAAAFENASSTNPEHWAGAAATCRRLLKTAADALRPPGNPVRGREMTEEKYLNRLVDWIVDRSESETSASMIVGDLEYLGRRLDAVADAGHKGAHAGVDRFDASRFLTGTYLLLGDILRLARDERGLAAETGEVAPPAVPSPPVPTAADSAEAGPGL